MEPMRSPLRNARPTLLRPEPLARALNLRDWLLSGHVGRRTTRLLWKKSGRRALCVHRLRRPCRGHVSGLAFRVTAPGANVHAFVGAFLGATNVWRYGLGRFARR